MRAIRYKTTSGLVTGVRGDWGRKYLPVVLVDAAGIRVRKLPKSEWAYVSDLDVYPVARAVGKLKQMGGRWGMTEEARRLLYAKRP